MITIENIECQVLDKLDYPIFTSEYDYISSLVSGISWKEPVRVIQTTSGVNSIQDNTQLNPGDRVLRVNDGPDNGTYVVQDDNTWKRASDFLNIEDATGASCFILEGLLHKGSVWFCTVDNSCIFNKDPLNFIQFSK